MNTDKGLIGFRWYWALKHQGDLLAQSSLPENYFKNTGNKLIDMDNHHFFSYNPYVIHAKDVHPNTLSRVEVRDIWRYIAPNTEKHGNDKSMAHQKCRWWGLDKCYKTNPDLYIYKDSIKFPRSVVINTTGQTRGAIPLHVLNHITDKYNSMNYHTFQIGSLTDLDANVDHDRRGCSIWESAKIISECEIFIGIDSLCYWLSKCYNGIKRKIILANNTEEECENFMPNGFPDMGSWRGWLECNSGEEYYNTFEHEMGITKSYLQI